MNVMPFIPPLNLVMTAEEYSPWLQTTVLCERSSQRSYISAGTSQRSSSNSRPRSSDSAASLSNDPLELHPKRDLNPKWFGSEKVQPDTDHGKTLKTSRSRSNSTKRSKSSVRSHTSEYRRMSIDEKITSTQRSKSTRGSHKSSDRGRSSRSRSTSTRRSKSTVCSKSTIARRNSCHADNDDDDRTCQQFKSNVETPKSKSTISRRHSADISSSKSHSGRRRVSAPDTSGEYRSAYSYRRGSSTNERSRPSSILKETPHQRQHKERGRSLTKSDSKDLRTFSSTRQSRSRSKSLLSRLSRGRSKEKTGQTGISDVIVSAGRSFSRSISRCSSISRNAFKTPKCTSKTDGHEDAEICTQRYSVPFNSSTGRCLYHPDVCIALRNEKGKGGWRLVSDGCPMCHLDQV